MELTTAFFARLVATLAAVGLAHRLTKARSASHEFDPGKLPGREMARLCVLGFAAALVPVFDPELWGTHSASALPALWILFLLAEGIEASASSDALDKFTTNGNWLVAWGLSLAVPVTLFGQTDLDRVSGVQNGLLGDLLPVWGAFFQPASFLVALLALAAWMRGQADRSLSPRRSGGLANGVLLATTVCVFLGAWHLPWLSDDLLAEWVGGRLWPRALIGLSVFVLKLAALEWIVRRMAASKRIADPRWSALRICALASLNLVLTWVLLCWRGA